MFEAIDEPLRMMTLGAYLLMAAMVLLSRPVPRFGPALILLMACVSAYLWLSGPWRTPDGPERAALVMLAVLTPFALWQLSQAVFEDARRTPWQAVATALLVGAAALGGVLAGWSAQYFWDGLRLAGLAALLHAIWRLATGYRNDLIEGRRRARLVIVGVALLYTVITLGIELTLRDDGDRTRLEPLAALSILLMTLAAGPALFGSGRTTTAEPSPDHAAPVERADPPRPDDGLTARIRELAGSESLFRGGLTISALAAELSVPEYRLRRAINQELGFRNFNAFLNHYRVTEAKRRLRDPASARLPVLTIAMDLGYGSIGPFNRAFRDATGKTPSDYRNTKENIAET